MAAKTIEYCQEVFGAGTGSPLRCANVKGHKCSHAFSVPMPASKPEPVVVVERRHRLLTLHTMHPLVHELTWWAHKWIENGEQFDNGTALRVAQALAEAEQRGRELERAAVVTWLNSRGRDGDAARIESGAHLPGDNGY